MHLFSVIFLVTSTIYSIGLLIFVFGLLIPDQPGCERKYSVSVIIAARNEEKTIHRLLNGLLHQTYPRERVEIVVVNDCSTDRTADVVTQYSQMDNRIKLIHVVQIDNGLIGKKNALHQGINASKGDIILTTDADCQVLPTWIETMVSYFTADVGMVAGFSQLDHYRERMPLFQKLQSIDFLAMFSVGHGAINLGIPLSASGQNLAYRRSVFHEVGGFSSIRKRITGDDVALLQLIRKNTNWKIRFANSKKAFNLSRPEAKMTDFLNQRKRWASDGSYQFSLNKIFFAYTLITYFTNLFIFISIPLFILQGTSPYGVFVGACFKFLSEGILLFKGCFQYERTDLLKYAPLWFVVEIPYVVYVGLMGTFGSYTWKDRQVSVLKKTKEKRKKVI